MLSCWTLSSPSHIKSFLKICLSDIYLFLVLMDGASGSGFGSCPKYPLMENFNISHLANDSWYGLEKSYRIMESPPGCVIFKLKPQELYEFKMEMYIISTQTRHASLYIGKAVQERTSVLNFQIGNSYNGRYHILHADYENFVILWSCNSWGSLSHFDQIWVIGKQPNLSAEAAVQIKDILFKLGLNPDRLVLSNTLCISLS